MSVRKCGLSSDMLYVVKVISSAWHQQVAPRTILRQQINNQYHQMTTIGAPAAALPWCVYLLSEQLSIQKAQISTNWKEKTRKWQQMTVVQVDRCICVLNFPVLHKVCRSGSAFESSPPLLSIRAASQKARPDPLQTSICKHSSKSKSKEKLEFLTGSPGNLMADGSGSEQIRPVKRNLQRFQM